MGVPKGGKNCYNKTQLKIPNDIQYKGDARPAEAVRTANDVEQGNIAWTKNPVFRNPDQCRPFGIFIGNAHIASMPGQKIFFTFFIPCEVLSGCIITPAPAMKNDHLFVLKK